MAKDKDCGHKCEQCVREEIAKLNKKVNELERLLPPERIIIVPSIPYVPYTPPMLPPYQPFYYGNGIINTLCIANNLVK